MTVPNNSKLSGILDEDGDAMITTENVDGDCSPEQALHDEHIKRVEAEAEAQAASQRLTVAQTQFKEYLTERAHTEEALAHQAQQLETMLQRTTSFTDNDTLTAIAKRIRESLAEAAQEVRSIVEQMEAETERDVSKRKQEHPVNSDVEMKRARDDSHISSSQNDDEEEDGGKHVPQFNNDNHMLGASVEDAKHNDQDSFRERAKYIPLRLDHEERRILRLLEGALNVSEYTDKVDILSYRNKSARVHAQIKDLCAILCGLAVAQNFKRGQSLISDRDFDQLATFFQDCFEVGRRHKIMNPEKMRDTYGKLCYMLMDSSEAEIIELLGFRCVRPLRTVAALLEERDGLAMLDDPLMHQATAEIKSNNRPRAAIQKDIKAKERAREALVRKYRNKHLTEDDLLRCLYSISDNNSFLGFSRDPIDRMIDYLKTYFKPNGYDSKKTCLAISAGSEGARLTHSHERQYAYVLQSLTVWREITHDMFKLWCLSEQDMMSETNYYRLQNTGQGLNRVQAAPLALREMHAIVARCQRRIGSWVGSSVIHLGDINVPNALMFIDKYTQVPRILNPISLVLDQLPRLVQKDPHVAAYIQSAFGGVDDCRIEILSDFFRHGFDGSGADNFFSAGSCLDGRLTSAWSWTSLLEKKPYYQVFKLCGFTSFDGDFK